MAKIDRLGWAAGFIISPYGTRIGVRTNDPSLLERLEGSLLQNWKVRRSGRAVVDHLYSIRVGPAAKRRGMRSYHLLYGGAFRFLRTLDLDELVEAFDTRLHLDVATTAGTRTFVHAGVVGWRGRAILVPGRTRAGKSTLVKALVERGADFYSDEYAVLDSLGRVHAYPRDLSLRTRGGKRLIPATRLGWHPGVPPLPVGGVVLTRFERGARLRLRHGRGGTATLQLFTNSLAARFQPERDLRAIAKAVSGSVVLSGRRGESRSAARAILEKLDG